MGSVVPAETDCGYAVPLEVPIGSKEVFPDIAHVPGVGGSRRIAALRVAAHVMELEHLFEALRLPIVVVPHDDEHKVNHLSAPTDILVDNISVHDSLVPLQLLFDRFDDTSACLVLRYVTLVPRHIAILKPLF